MKRQVLFFISVLFVGPALGQVTYSINEELPVGSLVGNVADDLGLDVERLKSRNARVYFGDGREYIELNKARGVLLVRERIDRETLCGQTTPCALHFQIILDKPIEFYRIIVEIVDINDNPPAFERGDIKFKISESAVTGSKFDLEGAVDLDVGINGLQTYRLEQTDNFDLKLHSQADGSRNVEMILKQPLDREKNEHLTSITTDDDLNEAMMDGVFVDGMIDCDDSSQRLLIEIKDDGEPVQSSTVTVSILLEDGLHEPILDLRHKVAEPSKKNGRITLYLILSLASVSVLSLVTFLILAVKCIRSSTSSGSCCMRRSDCDDYKNPNRNLQIQLNSDGPIKYVEVLGGDMLSQSQSFRSCMSPMSEYSDFTLIKPSSTTDFKEVISVLDASLPDSTWTFESQQDDSSQRLLIEIKDDGEPVQSSTVTVSILLEDGLHEPILDLRHKVAEPSKKNGRITLYLILSLASVSVLSLVTFLILAVKCIRSSTSSGSCCMRRSDCDDYKNPNRNLQIQLNSDGPIKYVEVLGGDMLSQSQSFRSCMSPMSEYSDFTLIKPSSTTDFKEVISVLDASLPDSTWTFESQQDDSSQRLLIEIKDDGEPVQSSTVTVSILLEDGLHEPILDLRHKVAEPSKKNGRITLYLILSLASVSVLSLVTFLILAVKCIRSSTSSGSCCMRRSDCDDYKNPNRNLQIQLNSDGPIKYVEVLGGDMLSQSQSFRSCMSPMSEYSDFTLIKPSSTTDFKEVISVLDASLPDSTWTFESQQDDSSQRLLIEIKDDGEPVQSSTVTVSILLEDGLHEPILDLRHKVAEPSKKNGRITLYLILSLASVSVLSLVTFLILAVKCIRSSTSSGSCCMRRSDCDDYKNPNRNLQIQLNSDGPIKYVEVLGGDMLSQSQSFRSCMSPMSEYSDFTLIKPSSTTDFKEVISVLDASLPDSTWTFESQQDDSSQRLLIEIKDDGEPVQSSTVTVSILLEDGLHEPILDLRHKVAEPSKKNGRITLYLILSLASVSVLSLVTFLILAVKCIRSSTSSGSCCMRRSDCDDYKNPNRNLQIQLNSDGPIKYVEVLGGDMLSQSQSFRSCMSPMSEYSDFTLIKPSSTTDFKEVISVLDASLPDSTWTFESQQDDSSQRLLIEIKDDGEPVQSSTVTVSILLEDGLHEPILDLRHKVAEPSKKNGRITLYLILSLASVSVLSLVTFLILAVKCIRSSTSSGSCCMRRSDCDDYKNPNRNLQIQLNSDGPIKYVEVLGGDMLSQSQSFRSCMSPMSEYSDFTLIKPSSTTDFKEVISVLDASLPDSTWTFESQQVPELLLEKSLDREKQSVHQLLLTALDGGNPVKTGTTKIIVTVLDNNDNVPVFKKPLYNVTAQENSVANSFLVKVEATDADEGVNGEIEYAFAEHTPQSLLSIFHLNSDTGEISIVGSLDYESNAAHEIDITAKDKGVPEMEGHCRVQVIVIDINDNAPEIVLTSKPDPDDSSQRLLIEIKDDGEPVQSSTVTVSILLEDGLHEPILDLRHKVAEPSKKNGRITLYLILSLASVSVLSLVTFLILAVKCIRSSTSSGSCCMRRSDCDDYKNPNRNLQIQLNSDGPIKYVEVLGGDMLSQSQSFRSCMSPMSEYSDFTLIKPSSTTDFKEVISVLDASLPDSTWTFESQQDDSSQRLLIEIKDDGEPVQSSTVTVSILLEDGLHEPILDLRHKVAEPSKKNGRITLYLILSLASVSVLSLVTFLILAVKCIRSSTSSGSCCMRRSDCDDYKNPNRNLQIQLNSDGPIKYVEVLGGDMLSQSQSFRSCMSPMSEYSDFTLIKPSSTTDFKEVISVLDASLPDSTWTFESQQHRYVKRQTVSAWRFTCSSTRVQMDDSSQRLLIEIKDDGEPVQSSTVTVSILLEDGLHEPILDLRHKVAEPSKKNGRITLYLILSLASVSVLSLVTFLILAVKCIRSSTSSGSCCMRRSDCDDYKNPNRNLQIQLNSDGPIKYVEVLGGDMLSQSQSFRSCMSPMSEYSDFTLIKPSSTTDFKEVISVLDASLPDSTWTFESQQVSIV
ncbi:hypothetical protein F2P81_007955 [Scophthalmus maximus]|uniref:Cadherin domain-containing protein n=1 Tax=Scophthalmus maximus TaxID=52904 RepID=A0A6A4T6W7_SCOMX|nr:hypothetical protein F2P81_007955 [Scophthalmus maximus]